MKLVVPTHTVLASEGFTKWRPKGKNYLQLQEQYLTNAVFSKARLIDEGDIKPEAFYRVMGYVVFVNDKQEIFLMKQPKGIYHAGLTWYIDDKQPDRFLLDKKATPFIDKEEPLYYFEGTVRNTTERAGDVGYVFSVETNAVNLGDSLEGEWLSITDAAKYYGSCDIFSKHILDYFYEQAKKNAPEVTEL